jgi:hypothetical protein
VLTLTVLECATDYKEYEMNARGTWWDLTLNKPYNNGGYENSSRVFGSAGWDDPGLRTAAKVMGCQINDPSSGPCMGWSVEIAFPLAAISLNNTNSVPPKKGEYWRINFSRVEWKVHVEGNAYVLGAKPGDCKCKWPCYPHGCAKNPGDNWLWAPLGIVDVHQPERWGYIQFATGAVNATKQVQDPDWLIRSVAMQLYYAELGFADAHNGTCEYLSSPPFFALVGRDTCVSPRVAFPPLCRGLLADTALILQTPTTC